MFATVEQTLRATLLEQQWHAKRTGRAQTRPHAREEVIVLDSRAIGAIATAVDDEAIELIEIALLPEFRSRGIGTAVIEELRRRAAAAERPIRLTVYRTNPRSLALYRRLGFRQIAADELMLTLESDTS